MMREAHFQPKQEHLLRAQGTAMMADTRERCNPGGLCGVPMSGYSTNMVTAAELVVGLGDVSIGRFHMPHATA